MSILPLVGEDSNEGVRQVFEEFRQDKSTSFVPNFFKTMANSPTAVRGTWDVYRQVGNLGVVPTVLKEMIFVVISAARNCKYCESAHLAFCKVLGVDSETMADLVQNLDLIRPVRLRDILKFSVTCALNPQVLRRRTTRAFGSMAFQVRRSLRLSRCVPSRCTLQPLQMRQK